MGNGLANDSGAHPRIPIYQSMTWGALSGVRSEMVDFGPGQGREERGIGPKHAIYGWTLAETASLPNHLIHDHSSSHCSI